MVKNLDKLKRKKVLFLILLVLIVGVVTFFVYFEDLKEEYEPEMIDGGVVGGRDDVAIMDDRITVKHADEIYEQRVNIEHGEISERSVDLDEGGEFYITNLDDKEYTINFGSNYRETLSYNQTYKLTFQTEGTYTYTIDNSDVSLEGSVNVRG